MDYNIGFIRKTCRTCARVFQTRKQLVSLFGEEESLFGKKLKFSDMLNSVSASRVSEQDLLPKKVCIICLQQIRSAFYFKQQAENSFRVLLTQYDPARLSIGGIKQETSIDAGNYVLEPSLLNPSTAPVITEPRTIVLECDDDLSEPDLMDEIPPAAITSVECQDSEEETSFDFPGVECEYNDDEPQEILESINHSTLPASLPTEFRSNDYNHQEFESDNFDCCLCGERLLTPKALTCHIRRFHSAVYCRYCKRQFEAQHLLDIHVQENHKEKLVEHKLSGQEDACVFVERLSEVPECDSCKTKFYCKQALLKHHSSCDRKCIECSKILPQTESYFIHLSREHGIDIEQSTALQCPFGCLKHFHSERILQDHIDQSHQDIDTDVEYSNDSVFNCHYCNASFVSQNGCSAHIASKHKKSQEPTQSVQKYTKEEFIKEFMHKKSPNTLRCRACKKDIGLRTVALHLKQKHWSVKPYRCEICTESFFRIDYRGRHMLHFHPQHFKCQTCDIQFDRAYKFDEHMVRHGAKAKNFKPLVDPYDLPLENIKFIEDVSTYDFSHSDQPLEKSPSAQKKVVPPNKKPEKYGISQDFTLQRFSSEENNCATCLQLSGSPRNLLVHKTRVHQYDRKEISYNEFRENCIEDINADTIKCLICDQKLKNSNFGSHVRTKHTLNNSFRCAVCPESFRYEPERIDHMFTQHQEMFTCHTCEVQFVSNSRFALHMKQYHSKTVSDSSDKYQTDLKLSELIYVARICRTYGKKFETETLTERKVEGEDDDQQTANQAVVNQGFNKKDFIEKCLKPYNNDNKFCIPCNLPVQTKNLSYHMMKFHASLLPYKCPFCHLRFEFHSYRMRHMLKRHPDDYKCVQCGLQFAASEDIAVHLLNEHNISSIYEQAPGQEKDLHATEIRYVASPSSKHNTADSSRSSSVSVQEPSTSTYQRISRSRSASANRRESTHQKEQFIKPVIKSEPVFPEVIMHSIFGHENPVIDHDSGESEDMSYEQFAKRHILNIGKDEIKCVPCDLILPKGRLLIHVRQYHATKQCFSCELCPQGFHRTDERKRHMGKFHPNQYKCDPCEEQFISAHSVMTHMKEVHQTIVRLPILKPAHEIDVPLAMMRLVTKAVVPLKIPQRRESILRVPMEKPKVIPKLKISSSTSSHQAPKPAVVKQPIVGISFSEFKRLYIRPKDDKHITCLVCQKPILRIYFESHLVRSHLYGKKYMCELCGDGYSSKFGRRKHMIKKHPNDFKCFQCNDQQFATSYDFSQHMLKEHGENVKSKYQFRSEIPMDQLKFSNHKQNLDDAVFNVTKDIFDDVPDDAVLSRVQFYGKFFRSFKKYANSPGKPMSKCLACNKTFPSLMRSAHAFGTHSIKKAFKCEICSARFTTRGNRRTHVYRTHPNDYKCDQCPVANFDRAHLYAAHMEEKHNIVVDVPVYEQDEINTPIDQIQFVKSDLLAKKMRKDGFDMKSFKKLKDSVKNERTSFHKEESVETSMDSFASETPQTSKCSICSKEFATYRALRMHLRNHTHGIDLDDGEASSFLDESSRGTHETIASPTIAEGVFDCSYCGKLFPSFHGRKVHTRMMHESTPVALPYMKKKYSKPELSYICDICDVPIHRRDYLSRHVSQNHNKEFDCQYCSKLSSSYNYYICHQMEEHRVAMSDTAQEFGCSYCDKSFRNEENRRSHESTKHNSEERDFYCELCNVLAKHQHDIEYHIHLKGHKRMQQLLQGAEVVGNEPVGSISNGIPVVETSTPVTAEAESRVTMNPSIQVQEFWDHTNDPFAGMLLRANGDHPVPKTSDTCPLIQDPFADMLIRANRDHPVTETFDEDHDPILKMLKKTPKTTTLSVKSSAEPTGNTHHHEQSDNDPLDESEESEMLGVPEENDECQEPSLKRIKIEPGSSKIRTQAPEVRDAEDKLEYLKYLQCVDNVFKCGICGKTKEVRKYMLHHLKQHDEVPTYRCKRDRCAEKFVFKKKYEQHLKWHEEQKMQTVEVDENPKIPDVEEDNEIKCKICEIKFKLKIMLNRHNLTWHGEENPNKDLTMKEQKSKKEIEANKQDPIVIRIFDCTSCSEVFTNIADRDEHTKEKHKQEREDESDQAIHDEPLIDQGKVIANGLENGTGFTCEKCHFVFDELIFLENHQKFFCRHRSSSAINEQ